MNNIIRVFPWRRLLEIGRPFWTSEMRSQGLRLLFIALSLLGANAMFAVLINRSAGNFMTAIEQRSWPHFFLWLTVSVLALIVTAPIQAFHANFRTRLALAWRKWLSNHLISLYFAHQVYARLPVTLRQSQAESQMKSEEIDNPEQRMTQDVDSFCNSCVGLFISILDALVNVSIFLVVLWSISPTLSVTVMMYSSLGLFIVSAIGRNMVELVFQQLKSEADLRSSLEEARERADEIRPHNVEERNIKERSKTKLTHVVDTLLNISLVNRNIQGFQSIFNSFAPLIPAVIIAPSYFNHEIPFGTITQAVLAFTTVFNGATILIAQFGGVTAFAAVTNRLGSLVETMETCAALHNEPIAHPGSSLAPKLVPATASATVIPLRLRSAKTEK